MTFPGSFVTTFVFGKTMAKHDFVNLRQGRHCSSGHHRGLHQSNLGFVLLAVEEWGRGGNLKGKIRKTCVLPMICAGIACSTFVGATEYLF